MTDVQLSLSNVDQSYWVGQIELCGHMLDVHQETISTAIVYFHRQCQNKLPNNCNDAWSLIRSAMLLACKATENVRRPRDVINVCHFVRYQRVMSINENLDERESLISSEVILLRYLSFNVEYILPYAYVIRFLESFSSVTPPAVFQQSIALLNDSFTNRQVLTFDAPVLAASAAIIAVSAWVESSGVAFDRQRFCDAIGVLSSDIQICCNYLVTCQRDLKPLHKTATPSVHFQEQQQQQ